MTHATTLGPPHASGHEPTTGAVQQRNLELARRAGWPCLALEDLTFGKYDVVEHRPTGKLYRLYRGEHVDVLYLGAVAFALSDDGQLLFLEAPAPNQPQTRDELEQRLAAREQRRAERATKTPRGVRR